MGRDGNGLLCKTAAVVLDKRHVATYAHSDHAALTCGQEVEVSWGASIQAKVENIQVRVR